MSSSDKPAVSVVIPAYNNGAYIARTVHSVLRQSFTDFELVISDHASSDDTWQVLQGFADEPRVRLTRIGPGGGAPRNWAAVTAQARGEFVKLVCGDDLLHPDALTRQVQALRRHPQASMVACTRDLIDHDDRRLIRARGLGRLRGLVPGTEAIRATILAGANLFGEPNCVTFRSDALAAAGGWQSEHPFVIDEATYARVLEVGPLVAQPEVLAAFRLSRTQWSVRLVNEQARQVVHWHHAVAARQPGLLNRAELALADARAWQTALMRRAAYLVFDRRMGPAE